MKTPNIDDHIFIEETSTHYHLILKWKGKNHIFRVYSKNNTISQKLVKLHKIMIQNVCLDFSAQCLKHQLEE